jgi:hypothetical protein
MIPILVIALAISTAVVMAGDEETPDSSTPQVAALVFRLEKNKPSADLAAVVAKVRRTTEDKNVLFVDVNLTTRGSRHQAKLLLNVLGLNPVWKANTKSAGRLILVDLDTGEPIKVLSANDGESAIADAIADALESVGDAEEDEGAEDDMK